MMQTLRILIKKKKKNRIYKIFCARYFCYLFVYIPVPHLPLLFQGVSAADLPTKSTSFIPVPTNATKTR